jgi:hypothetical protein
VCATQLLLPPDYLNVVENLSRVVGCWRIACAEREKSGEAGDLLGCGGLDSDTNQEGASRSASN